MPNGTVSDSVKFLVVFKERHFGLGFLGPHREVPIPKNSSHVLKDLKMTNKLRVPGFAVFEKIGSFIFRWLRQGS